MLAGWNGSYPFSVFYVNFVNEVELHWSKIKYFIFPLCFVQVILRLNTFQYNSAIANSVVFLFIPRCSLQDSVLCDSVASLWCDDSMVMCEPNGGSNTLVLYHAYKSKTQEIWFQH